MSLSASVCAQAANYHKATQFVQGNQIGFFLDEESGKWGMLDYASDAVVVEPRWDYVGTNYGDQPGECFIVYYGEVTEPGKDPVKENGVSAGYYQVLDSQGKLVT